MRSVVTAATFVCATSFACAFTCAGADARAQELATDRPDFTEGAAVVRRIQIESGYTFTRSGATDEHSVGEMLFRIGVARRIELRVTAPTYLINRGASREASGFDDAGIGFKLGLREGAAAAIIVGTRLPSGSVSGQGHGMSPEFIAVLEPSLGSDRVGLGLNAGVTSEAGDARATILSGSAVLDFDITGRTGLYIESYFDHKVAGRNPDAGSVFIDTGLTHRPTPDLQFDLRVGRSVNGPQAWYLGAGLVRRFR